MALTIIWTPEAKASYTLIVQYLEAEFGDKTVSSFIKKVSEVIGVISEFPDRFPPSRYIAVRKAFISKQTSMFYRKTEQQIEILAFWNNKRNAEDLRW